MANVFALSGVGSAPGATGARFSRERERLGPADLAGRAPVIVLASPYSGAGQLRFLLNGHPDLACTSGSGILPLCEQAMAAWRYVAGQAAGSLVPPGITTTRALVTSIITALLLREGKWRWCEIAAANVQSAETFVHLYPETKFLCLYRACPDVVRATLDANPWGIADAAFAPFTAAFPASTVAALTASWVAHTGPLLSFEQSHPRACLRIRSEDLTAARGDTAKRITSFLGISGFGARAATAEDSETQPGPGGGDAETDFPADLIPPTMLAQADDLLELLGYPVLSRSRSAP